MMEKEIRADQTQHSHIPKLLLAAFLLLYILVFAARLPKLLFAGQAVLLTQAVAYGILGVGFVILFRQDIMDGIKDWKTSAPQNILWVAGAFIVNMLITNIAALPAVMAGYEDLMGNTTGVYLMVQTIGRSLAILMIGLFAPVVEECVYRAFLIGRAKAKMPLWLCVIVSSILFALVHLQGFSAGDFLCVLPGLATGLVYGTAYAATGNITLPMLLHIANNMTGILLLG